MTSRSTVVSIIQVRPQNTRTNNRFSFVPCSSFGPGAYSYVVLPNGAGTRPCALASAPEATAHPSLPHRLQHLASLPHGEVVCAVTIGHTPPGRSSSSTSPRSQGPEGGSGGDGDTPAAGLANSPASNVATSNNNNGNRVPHFAYTGGRGCVKLWDLDAVASSPRDVVALASFDCLRSDSYVRSIKLFPVSLMLWA